MRATLYVENEGDIDAGEAVSMAWTAGDATAVAGTMFDGTNTG